MRAHPGVGATHTMCGRGLARPISPPPGTVPGAGTVTAADPDAGSALGSRRVCFWVLCHLGVLFLDEVCAFAPSVLDALRQPLEHGVVDVARAMTTVRFPARPLLICAGNPCPCGFDGDAEGRCVCPPGRAEAYRARLSGPVADRIDLRIDVPRLTRDELLGGTTAEDSATCAARVAVAAAVAASRGQAVPNALLGPESVRAAAALDRAGTRLMGRAVDRLGLTARGFDRVLRVGRTIADLAGAERVGEEHLLEAIGLRAPAATEGT